MGHATVPRTDITNQHNTAFAQLQKAQTEAVLRPVNVTSTGPAVGQGVEAKIDGTRQGRVVFDDIKTTGLDAHGSR